MPCSGNSTTGVNPSLPHLAILQILSRAPHSLSTTTFQLRLEEQGAFGFPMQKEPVQLQARITSTVSRLQAAAWVPRMLC